MKCAYKRLSSETGLITLCSSAQPVVNDLSACCDKSRERDESFLKDKLICPDIRFWYVQWSWTEPKVRREMAWQDEKVFSSVCRCIGLRFQDCCPYPPFLSKAVRRGSAEGNFSNVGLSASQFGFHTDEIGTTLSTKRCPVCMPLLDQPWPNFQISTFGIGWVRGNSSCCCWKDEKWINCKRLISERRRPTRAEL